MAAMAAALAHAVAGPTSDKKKTRPPKVHETVGDLSYVVSNGEMSVEGVGLVTGLDNTGGDSPPSVYRKMLVDEMSKAGVEHPERKLASPQMSIVIVRMTIPMGVDSKDPLDVQVEVPPGCPTKSLAGGYLLTARLFPVALGTKGEALRDHELAIARGPIMLGTPAKPNDLKVGRVLGGGRVKKAYPYTLVIKESRESYYTAKMLESVINARFHQAEDGHQKGMATGKTARYLVLKVPDLYHQNQQRYFRVIQSLPMIDGPELRASRLASCSKELLDPKTAGVAALKLEALGTGSVNALKEGVKSPNAQVRFFAAEALAYLNETAGVEVLGETVIRRPEFRAYALAALAALDQSASHIQLRKLMDETDIHVRYGAFNALRTLDPTDAYLGRVRVLDDPPPADDEPAAGDAMAMEIASSSRRRHRADDPFALYLVDSEGPPMVHVSRTRRTEVVVFGRQQKLLTPVSIDVEGGEFLINAGDDNDTVDLTKIVPSQAGDADVKVRSSLELAEVIRRTANLGASYPQIVAMLEKANKQKNLPGQLVVDAVPASSPVYLEAILGRDLHAKRDDAVGRASGETTRPRWRRLIGLGLFSRDHDTNPDPTSAAPSSATTKAPPRPAAGANATDPELPPLPGDLDPPVAKTDASAPGTAGAAPADPAVKKDDAVQQTSGGTPAGEAASTPNPSPPPRRRLLDFLRRDDD